MKKIKKLLRWLRYIFDISNKINSIQESLGRIESKLNTITRKYNLHDYEFKVFSQWGEDGIIEHLCNTIKPSVKSFIEFGVESYEEANTIFLLKNRNWRGLIIDGSSSNIKSIKQSSIYWRYDLKAVHAFITRDNINQIIADNGYSGSVGLLSIDIDGNDYWVWEAMHLIAPEIVIVEYNSLFGPFEKITVPYREDFYRNKEHGSNMYYGASISALDYLADIKGYDLVTSNSNGNNVFFVRRDKMNSFKKITPQEAYVQSDFREARNLKGEIEYISFKERQEAISHLPVIAVDTNTPKKLRDILC